MTTPSKRPHFHPYRLERGGVQEIRLVGARVDEVTRVAVTRGRETYFSVAHEHAEGGDNILRMHIDPDAIEGFYNVVLRQPNNQRLVVRDAFMVLDRQHHDGRYPMLPEYERWNYIIASDGIPMKDMAGSVGFVRHPLVTTYFLTAYGKGYAADKTRTEYKEGLIRLLNWLETQLSEGPGGALLVRHDFPLESFQLLPGWISGLTQGRVAESFLMGADMLGEPKYLEFARHLMEIFHVPVSAGGLLARDGLGLVCIEEYPTEPASWALNGIGSAIASLETVAHRMPIPWAEALIDDVCNALEAKIPLFDYPDYPGSKVQLALKHRISFEFIAGAAPAGGAANKLLDRAIHLAGPEKYAFLHSISVKPPLSSRYVTSYADEPSRTGADNEGLRIGRKPVWRELMIDGNKDADNAAIQSGTVLVFRVESDVSGRLRVKVKDKTQDRLLLDQPISEGVNDVSISVNWDDVLSQGVGRVAKYDEYYHETNLAWMWNISRYGARPRLLHAARRWLLSFYTGLGRIALNASAEHIAIIKNELDKSKAALGPAQENDSPRNRALRAKSESLAFLHAALKGEAAAQIVYFSPQKVMAEDKIRVHIFGYGFNGDEMVEMLEGDALPGSLKPSLSVISTDEAVLELEGLNDHITDERMLKFTVLAANTKPLNAGDPICVVVSPR